MSKMSITRDWLPPALVRALRSAHGGGIRFKGNFPTWEAAAAQCTGYNAAPILSKVLSATLKVKRGEAIYERDSVLFDEIEYSWPVTAALLWAAAQSGGRLDVLDFGGSLGSSYFQNRAFLVDLPKVRWSVVEQAHYVDAGCAHIQDNTLRFYSSIESCLAENRPNVVLMSSVLQYLPEPYRIIEKLCLHNLDVIVIDKTIVNPTDKDTLHIQSVPANIYSAAYPCRSFSEMKLLDKFAHKYRLTAKFASMEFPALISIDSNFFGFIFKANS